MITYRPYNTKLKPVSSWHTEDKTPSVEIHDPENRYVFEIVFGPNPKIAVFENSDEHNLDDEIHTWDSGAPKLLNIELSDLAEALNRCQYSGLEAGFSTKEILELIISKNTELEVASGGKIGNYLKVMFCRLQREK